MNIKKLNEQLIQIWDEFYKNVDNDFIISGHLKPTDF